MCKWSISDVHFVDEWHNIIRNGCSTNRTVEMCRNLSFSRKWQSIRFCWEYLNPQMDSNAVFQFWSDVSYNSYSVFDAATRWAKMMSMELICGGQEIKIQLQRQQKTNIYSKTPIQFIWQCVRTNNCLSLCTSIRFLRCSMFIFSFGWKSNETKS